MVRIGERGNIRGTEIASQRHVQANWPGSKINYPKVCQSIETVDWLKVVRGA